MEGISMSTKERVNQQSQEEVFTIVRDAISAIEDNVKLVLQYVKSLHRGRTQSGKGAVSVHVAIS